MRKIIDYDVVVRDCLSSAGDFPDLPMSILVKDKIKDGWEPLGGIAMNERYSYQVIVKYAD